MAPSVFKRVVDYGDGWMPNRVGPEDVQRGRATLDELARAAGRDPASLVISVFGQPPDNDLIDRFEQAGAARVMVRVPTADETDSLAELERIAEAVLR
jgi:alkanesulfonate monooxygenase SsuD/methylene tetrahydromethanopterin reductase-like flavin-dependent oxidoreductase (luciferase family)